MPRSAKVFDQGCGPIEFWSKRDQGNLILKAVDPCIEFGHGWPGEMLAWMGSPPCIGKKRAF